MQKARIAQWLERPKVQFAIAALIIFNAITLGLETSPALMAEYGLWLNSIDRIIVVLFVIEIALRWYAHGSRFFRSGWNWFDLIIVGVALVPEAGPWSALRAFRILRVLRLISVVPKMRRVVESLLAALPGLGSIALMLVLILYIFAVMSTHLFGRAFPDWFGDIGSSLYTLFQIMTLESWSMGIVRPVMEHAPWAWLFFVLFILLTTFTVLNLVIALIVNTMQEHARDESHNAAAAVNPVTATSQQDRSSMAQELQEIRRELQSLRRQLQKPSLPPG